MKNLIKHLSPILAFTLVVTSCQESGQVGDLSTDLSAITFKTAVTTRATDTAFETGDAISVSAYLNDGSVFGADANYTYNGTLFSSSSPIKVVGEPVEMSYRAVYPYVEIPESKIINFDVETDQSAGTNYTLSDLMTSYAGATVSTTPTLVFDHLLSKIVVNITSESVEMTNVSVTANAATGVEYNLATLSSEAQGGVESITMARNGVNSYKAILVPQTIASGETFVSISIAGVPYDISFNKNVTIAGGCQYSISATIVDNTITFDSPLINDWDEGTLSGDGSGNDDTATMTLAEISADALPVADTWVFTDESAESYSSTDFGDFTALHSALEAAATANRSISLEFPNLTAMPDYALYKAECVAISAPEVLSVGHFAIVDISTLATVDFPKVTSFRESAFTYCSALTSVNLPEVVSFGGDAFKYCTNLATVDLPKATTFGNYAFCAKYDAPNESLKYIYMPAATSFGEMAFAYCPALVSAVMPEVTTFGGSAFRDCVALTSVDLPKATSFGDYAFVGCSEVSTLSLPAATTFGNGAFLNCSSLTSLSMPNLTTLGNPAFGGCSSLTNENLNINSQYFPTDGSAIYSSDMSTLIFVFLNITDYTAPYSVVATYDNVFKDCVSLVSVSMPEVETVGLQAFEGCLLLESVSLPKATTFSDRAFTRCTSLKGISLPEATTFGSSAFSYSGLESISLPKAKTFGTSMFSVCSSLASIELPAVTDFGEGALANCRNLNKLTLATESVLALTNPTVNIIYINSVDNITAKVTLTIGSANSQYVSGNTFSVGDYSAEFAEIIVQ